MVQSVSTSGNIAAALMAASREREETRRRLAAEQAAANMRMAGAGDKEQRSDASPETMDDIRSARERRIATDQDIRDFYEGKTSPSPLPPAPKVEPTKAEKERKRREDLIADRDARKEKSDKERADRRARREARSSGRPSGRSFDMVEELAEVRAQGGQAAVDDFLRNQFPEFAEAQDSGMATNPTQAERKAAMRRDANRRGNNARDFRETFGQDASSVRNRFGDNAARLMRDRMLLAEARAPSYDMGDVMPEGFHRLDPDVQRLRVRRGQEQGRVTDAEMAGLLAGGDVSEVTGKAGMAMRGALGQETPAEQAMRLSEQGRAEEMGRVVGAGGQVRGNFGQQGVGLPGDAATRRGTAFRPNVFGSAAQGFGDYFQDPLGTTIDFYDRNIVSPARDLFGDILDRIIPR